MSVRTRVAPSPTGFVHIGFIHNALFAHALAKKAGGQFILRIEDTDQKRFVDGATEEIYEMMDAFGLTPDEGPRQGGPHEPYIQSERIASNTYREAAEKLVRQGNAYYCFLTEAELMEIKGGLVAKQAGGFRSPYRDKPTEEALARVAAGEEYVIRLKVPADEMIEFDDAILGKISINSNDVDDQVLLKSDGFPTYHLGVVVDDAAMQITHITRAYEWLASTPKHVLLYRYLGLSMPVFAHSSLILDPDGGKLSKRKGNVSAKQFLSEGYLPDAILNFLMLLGWSAPVERKVGEAEREIFSHQEFINIYDLSGRQKHNAVFNRDKLLWFNQQYLLQMDVAKLAEYLVQWIRQYHAEHELVEYLAQDLDAGQLVSKLLLVKERAKLLPEILDLLKFFYIAPKDIDFQMPQLTKVAGVMEELTVELRELFSGFDPDASSWQHSEWEMAMRALADKYEIKHGEAFMLLRVLMVGAPVSPPLFESLQILGKQEILNRLQQL